MIWYQILLLIIGIVILALSFIIPEKVGERFDKRETEKEVKRLLDDEVKQAISRLEEQTGETVTEAVERVERSLERVSNDKIMAVNEYSDTVLTDIRKNHEEVVFLYSMLDDKHTQLTDSIAHMEYTTKTVQNSVNDMVHLRNSVEEMLLAQSMQYQQLQGTFVAETMDDSAVVITDEIPFQADENFLGDMLTEESVESEPDTAGESTIEELVNALEAFSQTPQTDEQEKKNIVANAKKSVRKRGNKKIPEIQTRDATGNHNDLILKLHSEGKSNVAIAKELGLGVGEVKLVIDLFRQG